MESSLTSSSSFTSGGRVAIDRPQVKQGSTAMILMSFVLFAVLIVAWLAAPTTDTKSIKSAAPALKMSELPAD